MKTGWKRCLIPMWLLVALLPGVLHAMIVEVTPIPPVANVTVAGASTVNINWRIQREAAPNTPATVISPFGEFQLNGTVVATENRTLSRVFPGVLTGSEFGTFNESVTIPRSVITRAARSGETLTYTRTFDDGDGASSGTVTLALVGGVGGVFSIMRLELKFEDESRVKVVPGDERLQAIAEINFSGSGILQAVWEIAGPTSTAGEPLFRPLTLVRRSLAGSDRIIIHSPQLPTDSEGLYVIRLRIEEPRTGFELPVLHYVVTAAEAAIDAIPLTTVTLTTPADRDLLRADTLFGWAPIPEARAYMLEFYPAEEPDVPAEPPLTGVLVPGASTEARLESLTLTYLEAGMRYRWRVRAIGEGGMPLGNSDWREILVPGGGGG